MIKVKRKSAISGQFNVKYVPITPLQMRLYEMGASIEEVMPDLNPADQQFLAAGITEDEWNTKVKELMEEC